jgi:acyl carrier protein
MPSAQAAPRGLHRVRHLQQPPGSQGLTTHVSVGFNPLVAVRDAVAIVCEVDPASLSRATEFADLGADSLARVSIADLVEARARAECGARLHIDDASLCRMTSLGDLVDFVTTRLSGDGSLPVAS